VGCGEMGREGPDLGVGDLLVPADLLCDGGPELSGGDDVLEVVDLHDGRDGAAGLLEEVKHPVPRLLKRCRVRRHLHRAHRERHRRLLLRPSSVLRRQVLVLADRCATGLGPSGTMPSHVWVHRGGPWDA
jgi:hypothetical protein